MEVHLPQDWQRTVGQDVEIRRAGMAIRTGTVEAVMPDNSILWLSAIGAFPRVMVERADGNQVYTTYPGEQQPPV